MGLRLFARCAGVALGVCLASGAPALAEDRPAAKILAEIDAIKPPAGDPADPSDIKKQKAADQRSRLILELYKAHPYRDELARLMPERWQSRPATPASNLATKAEVEQVLAKSKNPKLVAEAAYYKALLAVRKAGSAPKLDEVLPAIDEFAGKYPKDPRAAALLFQAAADATDKAKRLAAFERIRKDYPDSPQAKQVEAKLAGPRDKEEMVGKPFELEFVDAIKGSPVSIAGLKGKVVVVDFWATWCPPCVAEMPTMKRLYAEYKDKGVEFIGVSLDQSKPKGGLDALKKFVAENKVEWPQYYQGNYWQSEFSSSWGINSIPCVFLVDADGKLASVEARGKLEKLIPEYLAKAKARDASASR